MECMDDDNLFLLFAMRGAVPVVLSNHYSKIIVHFLLFLCLCGVLLIVILSSSARRGFHFFMLCLYYKIIL